MPKHYWIAEQKAFTAMPTFVKTHGFPLQSLSDPIFPQNVDGTINTQGAIHHATTLHIEMGT